MQEPEDHSALQIEILENSPAALTSAEVDEASNPTYEAPEGVNETFPDSVAVEETIPEPAVSSTENDHSNQELNTGEVLDDGVQHANIMDTTSTATSASAEVDEAANQTHEAAKEVHETVSDPVSAEDMTTNPAVSSKDTDRLSQEVKSGEVKNTAIEDGKLNAASSDVLSSAEPDEAANKAPEAAAEVNETASVPVSAENMTTEPAVSSLENDHSLQELDTGEVSDDDIQAASMTNAASSAAEEINQSSSGPASAENMISEPAVLSAENDHSNQAVESGESSDNGIEDANMVDAASMAFADPANTASDEVDVPMTDTSPVISPIVMTAGPVTPRGTNVSSSTSEVEMSTPIRTPASLSFHPSPITPIAGSRRMARKRRLRGPTGPYSSPGKNSPYKKVRARFNTLFVEHLFPASAPATFKGCLTMNICEPKENPFSWQYAPDVQAKIVELPDSPIAMEVNIPSPSATTGQIPAAVKTEETSSQANDNNEMDIDEEVSEVAPRKTNNTFVSRLITSIQKSENVVPRSILKHPVPTSSQTPRKSVKFAVPESAAQAPSSALGKRGRDLYESAEFQVEIRRFNDNTKRTRENNVNKMPVGALGCFFKLSFADSCIYALAAVVPHTAAIDVLGPRASVPLPQLPLPQNGVWTHDDIAAIERLAKTIDIGRVLFKLIKKIQICDPEVGAVFPYWLEHLIGIKRPDRKFLGVDATKLPTPLTWLNELLTHVACEPFSRAFTFNLAVYGPTARCPSCSEHIKHQTVTQLTLDGAARTKYSVSITMYELLQHKAANDLSGFLTCFKCRTRINKPHKFYGFHSLPKVLPVFFKPDEGSKAGSNREVRLNGRQPPQIVLHRELDLTKWCRSLRLGARTIYECRAIIKRQFVPVPEGFEIPVYTAFVALDGKNWFRCVPNMKPEPVFFDNGIRDPRYGETFAAFYLQK